MSGGIAAILLLTGEIKMRAIVTAALMVLAVTAGAEAQQPKLEMCNNRPNTPDKTCLVDGDTLWLSGQDVGDNLINERLARRWPDGAEWWCE